MGREIARPTRIEFADGAWLEVRRLGWQEEVRLRKAPGPEKSNPTEEGIDYTTRGIVACVVDASGFTIDGSANVSHEAIVKSLSVTEMARVRDAVFGPAEKESAGLGNSGPSSPPAPAA